MLESVPENKIYSKDEETNSIFSPILFTTATKNQIIIIFIPFSTFLEGAEIVRFYNL